MHVRQVVLLITVVFTASVAAQDNANAGDTSLEGSAWGSDSDWTDSGSGSWGPHAVASDSGSWASHSGSGSNDFTIDAGHSDSKSKSTDGDTGASTDNEGSTSAPPTVAPSKSSAATRITPTATTVACLLAALVSAYFA